MSTVPSSGSWPRRTISLDCSGPSTCSPARCARIWPTRNNRSPSRCPGTVSSRDRSSGQDRGGGLTNYRFDVLGRQPHPRRGFTQGVVGRGRTVGERTGLYGQSALHRYQLGVPEPTRSAALPPELFGEGICHTGEQIWQLTWRERVALRWDPTSLELLETIAYNREGWGICQAGEFLVTSDGSSELVWRDPHTLESLGIIRVRLAGERLAGLNDLDWQADRIWANILSKPYLAAIDPASGEVTDVVDARAARERHRDREAVMNGLGALAAPGEFMLTGKRWRFLYHVRLTESRREVPSQRLSSSSWSIS